MTGYLLDVNVLLALAWPSHVHHAAAQAWFSANQRKGWATSAVTEFGFVRLSSHPRFTPLHTTPRQARVLLRQITALPHHASWPGPKTGLLASGLDALFEKTLTHALVTDAYLVAIAQHHEGRLATFDGDLRKLYGSVVERIAG